MRRKKLYIGGKRVSLNNGAGKTGQIHVKNEIRAHFNTIQKNKLKMD